MLTTSPRQIVTSMSCTIDHAGNVADSQGLAQPRTFVRGHVDIRHIQGGRGVSSTPPSSTFHLPATQNPLPTSLSTSPMSSSSHSHPRHIPQVIVMCCSHSHSYSPCEPVTRLPRAQDSYHWRWRTSQFRFRHCTAPTMFLPGESQSWPTHIVLGRTSVPYASTHCKSSDIG